jgi:D-alanine--poly(phosphoribitol) ligase subunit 1
VTEALGGTEGVASAACTTFDLHGDLGVVAFVVPNGELTSLAVRQAAGQRLPETMLPDLFVLVADLPLTSSSKVDERRLLKEAGLSPPSKAREPSVSPQLSDMEIDSLVKGTRLDYSN